MKGAPCLSSCSDWAQSTLTLAEARWSGVSNPRPLRGVGFAAWLLAIDMSDTTPKVSFGLPVRNGANAISRCLDSLLAQDLTDIEVLVSDNASTDGTQDILREYAARDARIRLILNEQDVGQIENFNGVVRESRGEYFRWIGAEDWLEPSYASECSRVLDEDPGAIVVTNYFRIHHDGGGTRYQEYEGELLESERPERRFTRMLWTFYAGDALYEPLYALIRRMFSSGPRSSV